MSESTLVTIAIFSIIALGIVLTIIWFVQKARQQKMEEKRAMAQFQMDMEREFISRKPQFQSKETKPRVETRFPQVQEKAPPIPQPSSPPVQPLVFSPPQQPTAAPQSPSPPLAEQVIMRLKEANLFESSEGPFFPMDPSGECVLIKLKQNKTALLVPRFESQHFIQNALKRFDYVFLVLSKEQILVLNSFSGFIAGHFKF